MYTIVAATMKHDSTHDTVLSDLKQKVNALYRKGWIPIGSTTFYVNAATQAMVPIGTKPNELSSIYSELDRVEILGSKNQEPMRYLMGGSGHMGVETVFENGMYYDF